MDSILSHGIEIRSENENLDYPPRAHVIKGDTRKCDVAYFGWQLFSENSKCKEGKYAILRLDVSKILFMEIQDTNMDISQKKISLQIV